MRQESISIVPVAKDDTDKINECAALLANEFADALRAKEEYQKNVKLFSSPASYCFQVTANDLFIGIIALNCHPWDQIKEQLYLSPSSSNVKEEFKAVSLVPFRTLIEHKQLKPQMVVDYAYTYICPSERGKGYASKAWALQEEYVLSKFPNSTGIIIVRKANCIRTDCQTVLLHMLARERQAQGLDPSAYVHVKGIPISTREIKKAAQISYPISFYNGVQEMSHLATKYGFAPFAFTKAFCPVFIKQNTPTHAG